MIILIAHSSTNPSPHLGDFITPRGRNIPRAKTWAVDNGAFHLFDEAAYVSMLRKLVVKIAAGELTPPAFVTLPDVVANHEKTLCLFGYWHRVLAEVDLNRAFVLQNV